MGVFAEFELLRTEHSRIVGNQGIPGACGNTLRHQMAGLTYKILTDEEQETPETEYYTLLLDNARDALGNVIGGSGLFDLLAQDILTAHQGGNIEIVRVRNGRYAGVPVWYVRAGRRESAVCGRGSCRSRRSTRWGR